MPADLRISSEMQACRELMRGGSKSFFAASLLLPQRVRAPATALYAFCRVADDAVDLSGDPHAAMAELRSRLDDVYAGTPAPIAADRALACTVHRHGLPRVLLDALLEGFLWDADGRRYETLADVEAYGARVAGTVGAAMAVIMGVRSPQALARACELGVAMQFTNIARDVGEDARNGRLYLPREWLREAGLDVDAWLKNPVHCPPVAQTVRRLLRAADELYERSEHGIAALPRDCRPAIRAARLVYAEIGHRLERDGLDSVNRRVVVPARRKAALMARAASAALNMPSRTQASITPLPAIQYLVDASVAPAATLPGHRPLPRSFNERLGWVLELMERQAARRGV
ncbi:phytoene/squalene synthase family protein [Rubrivivax gelatinosus]|uniref:Phytoene synthase n=1 Tax=Rubrivivax gelatinosus TaxID=28068 RepID=A0A4R2MVT6_RUBGE|nr:phytoene/squalene synthase family protein [Rubrivivax gelatinosus]MBK1686052.1 phytoene synthase [Rubrivivax gelatinosus]TCP03923.1 phytoene synthase [Rubrivivax gelatinosus]